MASAGDDTVTARACRRLSRGTVCLPPRVISLNPKWVTLGSVRRPAMAGQNDPTGSIHGWVALSHLAVKTSPATAAVAAWGLGAEPSAGLLLTAACATLFVNIVVPVSRALGRGWEYRIDRRLGTPCRPGLGPSNHE